jgi:ribonuclease PH
MIVRPDGRAPGDIRPTTIVRGFTRRSPGGVLIEMGGTRVLCHAAVQPGVPDFLVGKGKGWLTAEYNMLPGSTSPRKARDRAGKIDGRNVEIQRLIGRSLRNVARLDRLGESTVFIDCDVIEADGGTRTASITGAFVAVADALGDRADAVLSDSVAAVSVGLAESGAICDLCYAEDASACVDMNLVLTGSGDFIEVQGCGERTSFSHAELAAMLALGSAGAAKLRDVQKAALGSAWRWG